MTGRTDLKLAYSDTKAPPRKRRCTAEEDILIDMIRANCGKVPTLEEFLDFIYMGDVPEGATLELDIPSWLEEN
jgi:hypothetical protein